MKRHILVIDDDKIFNLMAGVMLREMGTVAKPRCFTDARNAMEYLRQHGGADTEFLVFLDINMPTMSGWEMLDRMETLPNYRSIHVVIVTSSVDRADRKRALGFDLVIDYMIKPLKREVLSGLKQHEKSAAFFCVDGRHLP